MSDAVEETAAQKWQRRRQIASVLNPGGRITYDGADRAIGLALHYRWNVTVVADIYEAVAIRHSRTIGITPIYDAIALAVFTHEGGHLEDPDIANERRSRGQGYERDGLSIKPSLEAELFAWRFSMARLGRAHWNKQTQAYMDECLRTYQSTLVTTYKQVEIIEAVLQEGRKLAGGVVYLKPPKLTDITQLRTMSEVQQRPRY